MIEREYVLKIMTGARGISEQIVRTGYPDLRGVDFTRPMKHGMATLLKQRMMAARRSDQGLDLSPAPWPTRLIPSIRWDYSSVSLCSIVDNVQHEIMV